MTVKELKKELETIPDDVEVRVTILAGCDGFKEAHNVSYVDCDDDHMASTIYDAPLEIVINEGCMCHKSTRMPKDQYIVLTKKGKK